MLLQASSGNLMLFSPTAPQIKKKFYYQQSLLKEIFDILQHNAEMSQLKNVQCLFNQNMHKIK